MKSGLCSATTLSGSALFPLSSRPERSVVERSAVVSAHAMKRGLCSATTLSGSAPLPFVISTGAQRSGEICGRLGPRDEKRSLFSNYSLRKRPLPFVISTGAQRSGEICGRLGPRDEKRSLFCNYSLRKRTLPFVISSGAHVVQRSAVVSAHAMKRGLCSATTLSGSAPLPFVISTG